MLLYTVKNLELLLPDFVSLELINTIMPNKKYYDYALVMGGIKKNMEKRLAFLEKLYTKNYSFKTIVLLTSKRPLHNIEKENESSNIQTEEDLFKKLYENYLLLKNKSYIIVSSPMKEQEGSLVRPITDDTVIDFNKLKPLPGSCLVISNNPYVNRQTKVVQRILDQQKFPTEGAGIKYKENINTILVLKELAKNIYEDSLNYYQYNK